MKPSIKMSRLNKSPVAANGIQFIPLNAFKVIKVLVPPKQVRHTPERIIKYQRDFSRDDLFPHLDDPNCRVLLRCCQYSPGKREQSDHFLKMSHLRVNGVTFNIKLSYTLAPYDITKAMRESLQHPDFQVNLTVDDFTIAPQLYFAMYLVEKIDQQVLLENFRSSLPSDRQLSIDMAKQKLTPLGGDISIAEGSNQIKLSLKCPITATRITTPARSKNCDHISCFDGVSFFQMNERTPRWTCPICKMFIKLEDLIIDGLFVEILQGAPPNATEVEILPDGQYTYCEENENSSGKRKLDNEESSASGSEKTEESANKIRKVEPKKEIEVITLDDSDDEATEEAETEEEDEEESDSDIEIVYEKIVKTYRPVVIRGHALPQMSATIMECQAVGGSSSVPLKPMPPQ